MSAGRRRREAAPDEQAGRGWYLGNVAAGLILAALTVTVLAKDVVGVTWLPAPVAVAVQIGLIAALAAIGVWRWRRITADEPDPLDLTTFSGIDELTGLANRRGFMVGLERELSRASRHSRECALLLFCIDDLSDIKEREGRLIGETALRSFGTALRTSARSTDIVGRLSDDEFGVLLSEASSEGAQLYQARVASAIAAVRQAVGMNVAVGSAVFPDDGAKVDELFTVAEQRMYELLLAMR